MWRFTRSLIAISILFALSPNTASAATDIESKFSALLIADEIKTGYQRSLFRHWIDVDGNGCNTRYEVLISEAITPPTVSSNCRLSGGSWRSAFDSKVIRDFRLLDVDHFVPLAEAWRSGAANWPEQQRTDFANDLSLPDSLIAVSRNSNRSKSDRDVSEWLPPNQNYRCQYLISWVEVKHKWNLTVDLTERRALEDGLLNCGAISTRVAPKLAPSIKPSSPKLQPSIVRYQNCTLAKAAGVTPIRRSTNLDLYNLNKHMDRDKDGVACE